LLFAARRAVAVQHERRALIGYRRALRCGELSLAAWGDHLPCTGVGGVKAVLGAREFGQAWAAALKLPLEDWVVFAIGSAARRVVDRRGEPPELSRREMQIVQLVAERLSDRKIAARLGISSRTVDNHLRHIFEKVGVSSRTALATWALRSALVA
jgi:DNA-binding CsgD family transcriptional regulator